MIRARTPFVPVLFALSLFACKAGGPESPFTVLDEQATSLRDRFNKDIGKTRVVMLVAPT